MNQVHVLLPSAVLEIIGVDRQLIVRADSVGAALEAVDSLHPGVSSRFVTDGMLRRFVKIFVNGSDIQGLNGMETLLTEGDEVAVITAVAGG